MRVSRRRLIGVPGLWPVAAIRALALPFPVIVPFDPVAGTGFLAEELAGDFRPSIVAPRPNFRTKFFEV